MTAAKTRSSRNSSATHPKRTSGRGRHQCSAAALVTSGNWRALGWRQALRLWWRVLLKQPVSVPPLPRLLEPRLKHLLLGTITAKNGPSARSGHRMVHVGGYIFVFGGFFDNLREVKYYNDLYLFDLSLYKWTRVTPSRAPCAIACSGFQLCVDPTGGADGSGVVLLYGGYFKKQVKMQQFGTTRACSGAPSALGAQLRLASKFCSSLNGRGATLCSLVFLSELILTCTPFARPIDRHRLTQRQVTG